MSTLASLVTSTSKQWTRALLLAALAMGCGSEAARDSGVLTDAGATSDGSSSGRTSGGASNDGAADAGSSPAEAAPLDDASSQCTTGPAGVTARRAADFLNLLSLQAHASNGTPAYLNATQFVADAQFVGARHVRDAVNTSGAGLDALKALVQAGITLVAQVAPTPGGSANTLVVSDSRRGRPFVAKLRAERGLRPRELQRARARFVHVQRPDDGPGQQLGACRPVHVRLLQGSEG